LGWVGGGRAGRCGGWIGGRRERVWLSGGGDATPGKGRRRVRVRFFCRPLPFPPHPSFFPVVSPPLPRRPRAFGDVGDGVAKESVSGGGRQGRGPRWGPVEVHGIRTLLGSEDVLGALRWPVEHPLVLPRGAAAAPFPADPGPSHRPPAYQHKSMVNQYRIVLDISWIYTNPPHKDENS